MNQLQHYQFAYLLDGDVALLRGTAAGCEPVLLALAGAAADASAVLRRFEHEYGLRQLLAPEWAVVPAELTRFEGRPALAAADPGGVPLALSMGMPFQTEDFLDIAIAVAEAMAAMHGAGLVHLDIKPAHLLVASDRQRAWITGFGFAAVASSGEARAGPAPILAATLAYMAPEQVGRGEVTVDARADLYALGVTFYQMLTGALPLEASEPVAWVHSHLARQPMAPAERHAGVPAALSAMVMRLLAKAPAERYACASALAADLRFHRDTWRAYRGLDVPADACALPRASGVAAPTSLQGRAREADGPRRLRRQSTVPDMPVPAAVCEQAGGSAGMSRFRSKVQVGSGALVLPWTQPLRSGRQLIECSLDDALRSGDLRFLAYCQSQLVNHMLACAEPLANIEAKIRVGLNFAQVPVADVLRAQGRYVAVLRGRAPGWVAPEADEISPGEIEARLKNDPCWPLAACCYWIRKLQACFALEDWRGALDAAAMAEPWLWAAPYCLEAVDYHFFCALALAWAPHAAGGVQAERIVAMERHRQRIDAWAQQNPADFGARSAMLAAEHARMAGDPLLAMQRYEQAARMAREQDLLHDEALAYELCARCAFEQGLSALAIAYLRRSSDAYCRWGAEGLVEKLEARASAFDTRGRSLERRAEQRPHVAAAPPVTYIGPPAQLDLDTVIRASQVLAGEMRLDRLIEALLTTTLEHAAAQRALLFLWQDGALRLAAQACTLPTGIAVDLDPGEAAYPQTIVEAALGMRADLLLDNAKAHARFGQDADVQLRSVRSAACLVLAKQGELVGLLYLENNLADGLFNGLRVNLLTMLASQAAISLENARLYDELLRQNQERERVQAELAYMSRVMTLGELAASIAHEVSQPLASIVTYGGACLRWIDRAEPDLAEVRNAVENMIAEGMRASEVIRRIRALARKDGVRPLPFALGELVDETLSMVWHQAASHGVAIVQQRAPGLPEVLGDRIQVQQVIINLLVNAIQSMSTCPGREHELLVSLARHDDGKVRLRVEDSGPGIEPGQLGKVFDAFYTTRKEGLGMGLSICRSILEAHGGSIWVGSPVRAGAADGQLIGAAFSFTLPAHQAG